MVAAIFLAIITAPTAEIVDRFDVIELNHICNAYGAPKFDQVIFWERVGDGRLHVQAWRLLDANQHRTHTEAGRAAFEREAERILDRYPIHRRAEIRSQLKYRGDFHGGGRWIPKKNHRTGWWTIRALDDGIPRRIMSRSFRETYTTHDPERIDRLFHHEDARRGLSPPPVE